MSSILSLDQLRSITPSLVNMTNAMGVPELGAAIVLAEAIIEAARSELATRSVDLHDAKSQIDAATAAAAMVKFGSKP